ncbi:hypothetical protein JOD57_003884 [Geodermatophilus bullaregiensis]|uniref:DUF5995 family protein n=1 Tax=Geodermatophilus bullaregiensis TaxID=1564160 RepID=UPI00195B12DB|nr:DUF5995 family protein [Geodermatophilus bullaregiensis]MBM7808047.1 hypothetical protein [Geodermatophilus bullaregiensis]
MTGTDPVRVRGADGVGADPAQAKVTAVADRLESYLYRYDAERDHRAPFAYVYLRLTRTLAAALAEGQPAFNDPDWVADLSVALAERYFSAMDGLESCLATARPHRPAHPGDLPHSVPQPWRDVYAASSTPRSYVLEDVLFSMMAHMSYDLPLALLDLRGRQHGGSRIADFHRMNDVLAASIDAVQSGLATRYWRALAGLDHLFTQQDELLSNYGIRVVRGMAWYNADRLKDPLGSADAQGSIERSTAGLIAQIRAPGDPKLRVALRVARWLIPARRTWPPPGTAV